MSEIIDFLRSEYRYNYIDIKSILVDTHHWNVYSSDKIADIFIENGRQFLDSKDLE